ncbi:MAG: chemotaxis protein CheB [Acidimicrobiia bacterium]|nr:chemotaxis protein CheB [Acidimicrobiia bacterium]
MGCGIIAMGASWGGVHAIGVVLKGLPADLPVPIVIAQHRGEESPTHLADTLGRGAPISVVEATDKHAALAGHAYLAPPGYHLLVERGGLSLSTDEPERFSRPSIDVLFDSVADAYRQDAVGVILTGASDDGAAGLARIRRYGGVTIVQEPATAARRAMPDAALLASRDHRVLALDDIAPFLAKVCEP